VIRTLLLLILIIYSLTLLWIEWQLSQPVLRYYVTDIHGPVLFYGINTTLSTFLLWAIALIFVICLHCLEPGAQKQYLFYVSQIIMFIYLGIDERFLIHETIGQWLGRNDAYLLLGFGIIEASLLIILGQLWQQSLKALYFIGGAGVLFAIMVLIDAFLPAQMLWRLAFEELTKLWADILLFLFAWEILQQHLQIKH